MIHLSETGYKVIKGLGEASSESFGWPEGTPQPNKAYCDLYSKIVMIQGIDVVVNGCPRVLGGKARELDSFRTHVLF